MVYCGAVGKNCVANCRVCVQHNNARSSKNVTVLRFGRLKMIAILKLVA